MTNTPLSNIPHESYPKLFWRFLKFGLLAWGGPVAQIAMIRQELVDDEKWISNERFNRVLAVYQVLPGPEAHELCVYFGMLSRGRMGAFLAGLAFMLPGFLLMFALSWFYVAYGITSPLFQAAFLGMQPAVAALIVRAVHRIGGHALHTNRWLWGIALLAGIAQLLGVNFLIILLVAGIMYALAQREKQKWAMGIGVGFAAWIFATALGWIPLLTLQPASSLTSGGSPTPGSLLLSGLRAGLLTFGGAYTAIPFLQHDAVEIGGWLTNAQFLDGLALSGLLPAPLIIFSTFIGYLGGGALGAIAITFGVFAPAFAFTMIGHDYVERLIENTAVHAFLDGVTAGVVGLIAATALGILSETLIGIHAWVIFALGLLALFQSKPKWTIAVVILSAGVYGLIFLR
ncbi:MAG: chromate efflux transporter [Anaerolineales bacterium]|nr:MAG: chromate efflux transporter [Anaerolineales bacterium]